MMPTASKAAAADYAGLSEEVASAYAAGGGVAEESGEEREEELELGLSLGARNVTGGCTRKVGQREEYCRILTAEDFPSLVPRPSPLSSSSSSTSSSPPSAAGAGFKRAAYSVSPPRSSQALVGWPPVGAFRMNSLVHQSKENADATANKKTADPSNRSSNTKEAVGGKDQEKGKGVPVGTSLFVKVNMDGDPIGRKVDLNAHLSYESLVAALKIMFQETTTALATSFNGIEASKLLDGSSEFALTYEDKDGDWMLVGDVPWGMFLSTVRRLRIMRTSEASGLAPRFRSSRNNVLI